MTKRTIYIRAELEEIPPRNSLSMLAWIAWCTTRGIYFSGDPCEWGWLSGSGAIIGDAEYLVYVEGKIVAAGTDEDVQRLTRAEDYQFGAAEPEVVPFDAGAEARARSLHEESARIDAMRNDSTHP